MHFFSLNVNIEFISFLFCTLLCMFFMQVFYCPSYLSLFVSFIKSCVTGYTKSVLNKIVFAKRNVKILSKKPAFPCKIKEKRVFHAITCFYI